MDDEMIRVVIKRPGEKPVSAVMDNTLAAFQRAVEGYVEAVSLGDDVVILCNEEGRLKGLEPNIPGFVGPLVFVGYDGQDNFTSLSMHNVEMLMYLLGGERNDPV